MEDMEIGGVVVDKISPIQPERDHKGAQKVKIFKLPHWATSESGNNLFQSAVASGARPELLLFSEAATAFLEEVEGENNVVFFGANLHKFLFN